MPMTQLFLCQIRLDIWLTKLGTHSFTQMYLKTSCCWLHFGSFCQMAKIAISTKIVAHLALASSQYDRHGKVINLLNYYK